MNIKAQYELRALLFWIRSIEEEAGKGCPSPGLVSRYTTKARERLDSLFEECFGQVMEPAEAPQETEVA